MKERKLKISNLLYVFFIIYFMLINTNMENISAATKYNASAALSYASSHWNDGKGKCAEFVSDCIKAGGCSSWSTSASTLFGYLKNSGMGQVYELQFSANQTIYMPDYNGKISAGDPVFYYCSGCTDGKPYVHTVLCNGSDASGYMKAYSHNNANSGTSRYQYSSKCWSCGGKITRAYVYHFNSNQSPKLTVDSIQANGDGTIRVRGWAFDPDDSSASITIHTYIGGDSGTPGAEGWQFIADLESVDVNNAYGINGKHRFDATIKTAKRGGNSVVVYALDTNQGTNVWYSPYSVNITNTNDINIVGSASMDEGKTKTISFSFKGDGIHQLAYGIHDSTIISASWGDTYWDKTQSNITVNGLKEGKTILDICFLDSNGKEFYKESITITVNHVHKYTIEKVTKEATCLETGLIKYYCSCGAVSSETTTIAKKNHTYVTDVAVEATCTQTGKTEGKHCSVCGYVLTAQEIIPTKEHNYVTDVAVEATCTQTGKTEGKHCSVCEYVLTAQEIIPAKEHNYVTDVAVEATCTQTGKTEGRHCSICEYVDVPQTIIPVKDHILDEGIIIKQPTKSECGERQSTCKVCKQKFLTSIPIINAGDTNDSGSDETNNGNQNSDETNNGNQSPDETTQNNTIDQEVSKEDNSDGLDDEENIDDEKITMPPSVGTITTYSGMKYKVIKNGKDCYVQCLGPVSKNVTKATIKSYIYIGSYRYPVCQIKSDAFKNCKKLTKVVIGDNVKTIGKNVFYGCKKLKSITIQSKKLSVVKKNAFKGIYKKAKIKVPKSKRTKYKKLLKKAGVKSTAVIK